MAKRSALSENDTNTVHAIRIPISEKDILNNNTGRAYNRNISKSVNLETLSGDIHGRENVCTEQTEDTAKFLGHFIVGYIAFGETECPASREMYASVLRQLADTTLSKHRNNFDQYIAKLELDNDNTRFSTLCRVFDMMIDGKPGWERIVVVLCFGGWLAKHTASISGKSVAEETGVFLGKYVSTRLGRWIDDQGGWEQFPEKYRSHEKKTGLQLSGKHLTVAAILTATAASVFFCTT